jgi:ribosomal 50S subunit-associated protein YjgA (DUF615 family)
MDLMENQGIKKAKGQLYTVSVSDIEKDNIAMKKLVEELEALGMHELIKRCTYKSKYQQLRVVKRKGGGNIF